MNINLSTRAQTDLTEITNYLLRYQPNVADETIQRIADRFHQLARSPHMGRPRSELGERVRGLLVAPYLALYRIEDHSIVILRVLHTSRNLTRTITEQL